MRIAFHKNIQLKDIEAELDRAWVEMLEDLKSRKRSDVVTLKQEGQGLDPITTAYLIAFAPVSAAVAKDIWMHFLLPRLKRKFGEDAVREDTKG